MMRISTYISHKVLPLALLLVVLSHMTYGQENEKEKKEKKIKWIERVQADTSEAKLNMDAIYGRPSLTFKKVPVALGGYLEANSIYTLEDGITEGLSFQARRLTLFVSASVKERLRFLTEIEFEEGGKEINIEFASMDLLLHPAINARGGIVLNPIGGFNQNHDGPKWEFVERPDMATQMLPATFSNAGFGLFGKVAKKSWVFGYELYLTNGFNNSIIDNEENRTFLGATKSNFERFEESSNGVPLVSAKAAIKHRKIAEVGLSYMGGVYNKFMEDGLTLDRKRRVDVFAIDFNTTLPRLNTYIVGEFAMVFVDVPDTYTQRYGMRQQGAFIDIVQPVLSREIRFLRSKKATLNLALRFDYVDWNIGTFNETNTDIGDRIMAITPAISFRPWDQTVIRLNYRYQWQHDLLNNPPALASSWLFGFSTYF